MPVRVSLSQQSLSIAVGASIGRAQQQAAIAQFARTAIAEAESHNRSVLGYEPVRTVTVDGREGARLESVEPDGGLISAEFDIAGAVKNDVAQDGLKLLAGMSPVISGQYRDGHRIYVNGAAVDAVPLDVKPGDIVMLANPVAYARRIEVGRTESGRAFVVQVEPNIYRRAATVLRASYGNQVKIEFMFVELPDAGEVTGRFAQRSPRYQRGTRSIIRRSHAGEKILSPAILIGNLN